MTFNNRMRVALFVGLVSLLAASASAWFIVARLSALHESRVETMITRAMKTDRERVERYFDQVDRMLRLLADSRYTREAIMEFSVSFEELGDGAPRILRRLYVEENPYTPARRQALIAAAGDDSWYSELHLRYHPWFRATLDVIDVRDLFLVSEAGDVVYSVAKGELYGERLTQGANGATKLADVFREIIWNTNPEAIIVADFSGHRQGPGAESAYLGTPVFARGERVGGLVIQLNPAVLERLMVRGTRIGSDLSSFLVGDDHRIRAASRPSANDDARQVFANTAVVDDAVDGLTGVRHAVNRDGDPIYTAFGPLQWHDRRWAVVVELDVDAVRGPLDERIAQVVALICAISVLLGALGYLVAARDD